MRQANRKNTWKKFQPDFRVKCVAYQGSYLEKKHVNQLSRLVIKGNTLFCTINDNKGMMSTWEDTERKADQRSENRFLKHIMTLLTRLVYHNGQQYAANLQEGPNSDIKLLFPGDNVMHFIT